MFTTSRYRIWPALFFALCVVHCGSPGGPDPATEMELYMSAAVKSWNFQGSVLVAKDGGILFRFDAGPVRIGDEAMIGPSTKYPISSVSKTFTAAAVLQLRDKGRLNLSDPVSRYVPGYPEEKGNRITVHHLLSHTAGVPDIVPDPRVIGDLAKPREPGELLDWIKDKDLEFEPGESYKYSNAGYVLLGLIIEKVSGQSYSDYLRDHIFSPLGMNGSGVCGDCFSGLDFARGYIERPDGRLVDAPLVHPSLAYAAGAVYSTAEDLFKWGRALSSPGILSDMSLEQMSAAVKGNYGYGWLVMNTWGKRDIAHGGGAPGFSSWIERWPDDGVFVAVLSNNGRSPTGEIGRSLAAILFGQKYVLPEKRVPVQMPPEVLERYTGSYEIDGRNRRDVVREGGTLFVRRNQGPKYPVLPYAEDSFFFPNDKGATIRFLKDAAGRTTGHIFHQLGVDETAEKRD